jgi:hypothetical protein
VNAPYIKAITIYKREMTNLKKNVFVILKMVSVPNDSIITQKLILRMEELNKTKERNEVKLVILEANIVKESMKCKRTDLEKFKKNAYMNQCLGEYCTSLP